MALFIHVISHMMHYCNPYKVAQNPFHSSDRLNQKEGTVSYAIPHVRVE